MPDSYPYILSNNKIEPILAKIRTAAKPSRFNREFLKNLGFGASNDRAIISVLRELGFLGDGAVPTADYDRLRDSTDWKYVLAEKIRELYSDLYALNTNIHKSSDDEIKGAITRLTGKDERSVTRYFLTFKTLASLANFEAKRPQSVHSKTPENDEEKLKPPSPPSLDIVQPMAQVPAFHYNIQIHLPATTDIAVYNAIFKSLKEHLSI